MKKLYSRAPLRISYAGGGTDLEPFCSDHGGVVIAGTINHYAYTTIESCHAWEFVATDNDSHITYKECPDEYTQQKDLSLLINSYVYLLREFKLPKVPVKITTTSDVLPGSGLGSSSAICVSLINAILNFFDKPLNKFELAQMAHVIERDICQLPGGKQDQYASVFGGLKRYNFSKEVSVDNINCGIDFIKTLNLSTILYDTGTPRPNSDTIFNIIDTNVDQLKNNQVSVEKTFKLKTNCLEMFTAIEQNDINKMANIFNTNWVLKKKISPTISNSILDEIHDIAIEHSAMGAKICGAGGGGHVIFLVDIENRSKLIRKLNTCGGKIKPFLFTQTGAEIWKA